MEPCAVVIIGILVLSLRSDACGCIVHVSRLCFRYVDWRVHPTTTDCRTAHSRSQVMCGEYVRELQTAGDKIGDQMDKMLSGFIRTFEEKYSKLESAIRLSVNTLQGSPERCH